MLPALTSNQTTSALPANSSLSVSSDPVHTNLNNSDCASCSCAGDCASCSCESCGVSQRSSLMASAVPEPTHSFLPSTKWPYDIHSVPLQAECTFAAQSTILLSRQALSSWSCSFRVPTDWRTRVDSHRVAETLAMTIFPHFSRGVGRMAC